MTLIPKDPAAALRASLIAKRVAEIDAADARNVAATVARFAAVKTATCHHCHVSGRCRLCELEAQLAELTAQRDEMRQALRDLLKGPVFHCVPEGHVKHWPQIAAADAILDRTRGA